MDLSAVRRAPDVEGPGLEAFDAADRLILDEAQPFLASALSGGSDPRPASASASASGSASEPVPHARPGIAVIGDTHGALALSVAADLGMDVRVHQDALLGERAILANAQRLGLAHAVRVEPATPALVRDARIVLLRLPRSLDALDELTSLIADHAAPGVVVVAGGRLKHMSVAMNDVLRRRFARLDVTHARQKSRVLIAREPGAARPGAPAWPRRARDEALGLTVVAHGGVFAGTTVDVGTRFLLDVLDAALAGGDPALVGGDPVLVGGDPDLVGGDPVLVGGDPDLADGDPGPGPRTVVDLACGTGIVAVELARRFPRARVVASDQSAAAAASARQTAAANGLDDRIVVERADGLEFAAEASVDLVVLNPPFHAGAAVTTALAERLFAEAGRALEPGGRLVAVWNSHLRYRPALERLVGPTRQVARNPKFTVTVSTRRPL
ncbi:class I SAM-dependent methyltransferase [Agromyces aerolatus]|uniref:class I SAM-dependent methyltransferase n=1 Tax=Agromyces sp. LY-1074 TaxID=3074080 RepID=UPI00285A2E56|nr:MULTISPECIES: methyltransferase [unclassified Agromyces]MDR5701947.1 methyltransferase [Agromyces sp. LY-1074]MDR5708174.1 methyltransferase [Agromyces sp. LY-1358]